jgi:hypothetical protein
VVAGTRIALPAGDCGTVSDSGFAAETWQQEYSTGAEPGCTVSAGEPIPIMWQGWPLSPTGALSMQWSGMVAAGITNTAMTARTAATDLIVRVNIHSAMLQI